MNQSKYAVVFPGQGSQSVGMLADIAPHFPAVKTVFERASAVLGYDLWQLIQQGPAEELDKTMHTQPALLAASYAIWQILQTNRADHLPVMLAGHSLGEYTALVGAESLCFEDAICLVAARGCYMQEAVAPGEGAMAALIGLDEDVVNELCHQAAVFPQEIVTPANFNSLGQIVIAGHAVAVDRVVVLAKAKGARLAKRIPVSVPSHCLLMKPAADKLASLLATIPIHKPRIPVLNNVNASLYVDEADIKQGLIEQLYKPVRWVEIIRFLAHHDVTCIIECGPGKILSGLNKRIVENNELLNTADLASLQMVIRLLSKPRILL